MAHIEDPLTAKEILFQILRFAILEIRVHAVDSQPQPIIDLANLTHNLPQRLKKAEGESDYQAILDEMWQRADPPGRAFMERLLAGMLHTDPTLWGA